MQLFKILILKIFSCLYKLKRCSNKECCKQCRYVKFKGTMTKQPVQKLTHRTTQKHVQHHDATRATDIQTKTIFLCFSPKLCARRLSTLLRLYTHKPLSLSKPGVQIVVSFNHIVVFLSHHWYIFYMHNCCILR